ncbi:MAG: non-ribosomal peptide synthetase [Planctomycetota bacterium]|nr:non-ribosomal peptide synthetase [Planctomycetota bacterium]MDA1212136.1 non-ribosomal peptide synthetase [Planctomycetota bacterium]
MPLFHIHGIVGAVLSTLSCGASVVCTPGFNAENFLHWMAAHEPTWYTAVPTMHQMVLEKLRHTDKAPAFSRLRLIRSSSSALPPQVMKELESRFRVPIVESYGMTEAAHQMCSNPLAAGMQKPGSVGKPAGPEVGIMNDAGDLLADGEIGEIVIRGENVTPGYEGNPKANAAAFTNGWFRTGDQGYRDGDGYYILTGRLKEIVNRGGEKISPREVDEVLLDHPDVRQAVAFAVPHPRLGEDLAAAVVLHPGRQTTEATLRDFVFQKVVPQKVPTRMLIVNEIPKGPTGKLQRIGLYDKLKDQFCEPKCQPNTECQAILFDVWRELFETNDIGIDDNFFYIGGDSLLAMSLLTRICPAFEIELAVGDLFRSPTIRSQAELIEQCLRDQLESN